MARCFECNSPAVHDHHVVPRIYGGTRTIPLCALCHSKIHGKNLLSITSLTKKALAEKKKKGERVGAVPFGFVLAADQKTLIKSKREQDIIKAIVLARMSNFSLHRIARWLTAAGIPTKTGKNKNWGHQVISRIIERAADININTRKIRAVDYERFSEFKKHIADMGIGIII